MLDLRYWTFSSPNLRMRAIVPPNSKFRLNRTICIMQPSYSQKMIFNMASVHRLEFGNLKFSHVYVAWVKICVRTRFRRLAAQMWRYDDFQNGGRPPCWIYCDVIILYRFWRTSVSYLLIYFNYHGFTILAWNFNFSSRVRITKYRTRNKSITSKATLYRQDIDTRTPITRVELITNSIVIIRNISHNSAADYLRFENFWR